MGGKFAGSRRPVETPPGVERERFLRFRFDRVDLGSPWCITKISAEDHRLLMDKLRDFERMTVNEVFHQRTAKSGLGSDYSDLTNCPNPALLRRLAEIGLKDVDGVSRLRLTGRKRLYGIRMQNEFSILWWDPLHAIWPSQK